MKQASGLRLRGFNLSFIYTSTHSLQVSLRWIIIIILCCNILSFLAEEESPGRPFILDSIEEAKKIVDAAYKYSRDEWVTFCKGNLGKRYI